MAVSTGSVAGVVAGRNPLEYSASSPYTLFLFQAIVIMAFCHILNYPLRKLQQPRVIAEVLSGILLGPTVMGRIPGFTSTCFPPESKAGLTLVANVGIILFLFIVGLEVDLQYIRKNARVAFTVGFINMAIPFGLGCAIARGLYNEYHERNSANSSVSFSTYMVFIAVALCITAFPVLARILVDLNLIGDRVGTIVLSAGIINDLVGWILLALVVTLANADSGVHTVYILLLTVAWFLLLMYPVRAAFSYYLRNFTSDLATGVPSQVSMVLIIGMVFASAFYTDIIGVHPIFGAFMVGVIVPRDNGYVIKITEKLEDLVHLVMIPIYFAIAGLNVNLGDLSRGIDWAYVIAVIALAMVGKIAGGYIAAKVCGLVWRDSLAVGVLMSCKGIVEIVVLNIGLSAHIISPTVYSMFIVMALVTTFLTTPLALWVYPPHHRHQTSAWGNNRKGEENEELLSQTTNELSLDNLNRFGFSAVVLLLKKIDTVSNVLQLLKDLNPSTHSTEVKAIHLRQFDSRTSHLLEASSSTGDYSGNEQEYADSVSMLAIVKAFSSLLHIKFSTKSLLAPAKNFMALINEQVSGSANLLLTSMVASSLVQNDADNSDLVLEYDKLLQECKCHVAVLLTTQYIADDPMDLKLVLDHNDRLSGSDLLAIHLLTQLQRVYHGVSIYIRSSSGPNREFEDQFLHLFQNPLESQEEQHVSVHYFKDNEEFLTGMSGEKTHKSLYVVTYDFMNKDQSPMLRSALHSGSEFLVVRASL